MSLCFLILDRNCIAMLVKKCLSKCHLTWILHLYGFTLSHKVISSPHDTVSYHWTETSNTSCNPKICSQLMMTKIPNSKGSILTAQHNRRIPPTNTIRWLDCLKQNEESFIFHHTQKRTIFQLNTLRMGAFKLFKCTFLGFKQCNSTFTLCFFKNL